MPEQHEELRLALVMNGGVSLAVWMGGVSNEIFRVVTQQHPVYAALLELTRTTARVDVISGTSAGGVNGAALGLALLYGGDFSKLREVWLKTGAFGSLLRPPLGENPGSLLMGEEFFLPQIIKAFESLAQEQRPIFKPDEMPIDLRLTTTLLRGQQGHSVDDLGTHIHDVDYRGQFRFRHMNQQQDFGNRDQIIAELARAARSTASFPFAFEPSPVKGMRERLLDSQDNPLDADPPVAGEPEVTRYVVDGGVLNNKPFRGALRSIFGMPAQRGVRRVLAYINPDPGDGPPGKPVKEPPPLSSVLGASLFGIPQSQSIADQLADIQDHNDGVRARRNSVVATVLALSPATLDALPAQLFAIYRQRRLTSTFDGFVYDELPAASRRRSREPLSAIVGRRGRDHLLATFLDVNWDGWIPTAWPLEPSFDVCCRDVDWEWGLYPVEFAIKVMLDLLRRTQQLCDFEAPMQVPPAYEASGKIQILREPDWTDTPNPPAVDEPDSQGLMKMMKDRVDNVARAMGLREGKHISWDREHVRSATKPQDESHRKWLVEAWSDAYRCVRLSERFRDRERVTWRENADELLDILARKTPDASSGVDLVTEEDFRRLFAFLVTPRRRARCGLLARHVAMVLNAMSEPALALAAQVEGKLDLREHDREAARQVRQVFEWFLRDGPGTPECRVLRRLM